MIGGSRGEGVEIVMSQYNIHAFPMKGKRRSGGEPPKGDGLKMIIFLAL